MNLAAQAGVRYSIDHPDVYIESNIVGFYNILEACRRHPVEHLVYASSSSVYGGNKKLASTGLRFFTVYGLPEGRICFIMRLLISWFGVRLYVSLIMGI